MTGTIEQLHAKVDAILAILQAGNQQAPQAALVAPQALAQPQVAPQTLAQPQAAPVAPVATVTAEMITALITPHVGDPNLKAALQQQMAALGIGALPDAQPHQYADLYNRFQQVITQFTAAAAAQPQAAAIPASII